MEAEKMQAVQEMLDRVRAARSQRQLEVILLSAEAQRLERRLKQLRATDDASSAHSDSEDGEHLALHDWPEVPLQVEREEVKQLLALPPPPPPPPPPVPSAAGDPFTVVPPAPAQAVPEPAAVPTTVLASVSEPPCSYSCFRAGPPLLLTILNDILTFFCHWRRSREIICLSSCNLASRQEKIFLRKECFTPNVMEQHTIVNFVVWRRSVLLLLYISSLGAFLLSVFGDNWSALSYMRDMESIAHFKVNFRQWRDEEMEQLPFIDCTEIDDHFAGVLESLEKVHTVAATTCVGLLQAGVSCEERVERAVVGCWQPGLCQQEVNLQCPSACGKLDKCRDIRESGSLDYMSFTVSFGKAMFYKLIEQLSKAELSKLMFSCLAKFVACVLMLRASLLWADWPRSNRLVLWAWLVTFSAPFLRSTVPTPLLIDWGPIDAHVEEYLRATDQHFDLGNRMAQLAHMAGLSCHNHRLEEQTHRVWETTHHKVHWWCGRVQWGARFAPWSRMLQQGARQCQLLTNYMGVGDVATLQAQTQKQKLCHAINATHIHEEPLNGVREVIDVNMLRSAAYGLVGGLSSILSFRVILPEALSVAPGLLTAAIRIKVVVPQSYLPGVFIAIMPLLYVPTVWSFCIFVVQGVGDPLLLVAVSFFAFSPLAYTVLGIIRHVTSPMSRNGARSFATLVQRITRLTQAVALACLLAYIAKVAVHLHQIEESRKGITAFLLDEGRMLLPLLVGKISMTNLLSLACSGPLWSIIFTFWTEVQMTAVVGADWMLRSAAEEYDSQGEDFFVELEDQGCLDRAGAEALHQQRRQANEAMLEVTARRQARKGH